MTKTSYLVKRGHIFWWRRRRPVFILPQPLPATESPDAVPDGSGSGASGHFAFSLRTPCPREAGRRAARMNSLFEETRRSIETAMARDDRLSDESYLNRAMADMAATLRAQAELLARQMAIQDLNRVAAPPTAPPALQLSPVAPAPMTQVPDDTAATSRIDDPEFERAVLEIADREGWWHDDPDAIVEQFDMMLTGLFTLQEEYLRYCIRKNLDPGTALPSLVPLGGALSSVKDEWRAASIPAAVAVPPEAAQSVAVGKQRAPKSKDGRLFSEHAKQFLARRSEGFDLKKRNEVPDAKAGQRFITSSLPNFQGTVRLFLEAHGDIFVENIDEALLVDFFSLLDRIPASHGKSSKDRRPVRSVIDEADREQRNAIERRRAEMERDGMNPGEIEDSIEGLRIPRLRTNTCKRHMDAMDQILGYAVFEGLRPDNPARQVKWTHKDIARRLANEENADRLPWGDRLPKLLGSPIYRQPLVEPGDPLFWAPLVALFAGLRLEETLQLGTEDFDTDEGVPVMIVQLSGAAQSLKSMAARRTVPIHDTLLDLGLLKLVELRRAANQKRLFTYLERGQAKGTFGEIFSKRFTTYRKKCGIYDSARDFHALRKDFQTKLTRAEVPYHSRKLLMGHELSDVTHKHYYPEGDTIEMMRNYINRIEADCSRILRPFEPVSDTNVLQLPAIGKQA